MSLVPQVKSWSFSRLGDYDPTAGGCPLKFKLKHIDKIPEEKSPAMDRGTAIHKLAEDYIGGVGRTLPKELGNFADFFKELRATKKSHPEVVQQEQMWGFTRNWEPCGWKDWNNCWLRVKVDCVYRGDEEVPLWDWKTGKFTNYKLHEYVEQVDLYATASLVMYGDVRVIPGLVFLDTGDIYPAAAEAKVYTLADLPALKKKWEGRVKSMFADTKFLPRPSESACRFCSFSKAKGGPCKF